jgi:hypothetical protein
MVTHPFSDRMSPFMVASAIMRVPLAALLLTVAVILLGPGQQARAQQPSAPSDTARVVPPQGDTLAGDTLRKDSLRTATSRSGLDTVVTYSAHDSIVFDVPRKRMLLYGDAVVINGAQKLSAAYIEIDFQNSELYAEARYDSVAKKYYGVPLFKDVGEEFTANTIRYNFKTKRGTLGAAETAFNEGFYYGEKIKRVDENTLFVKNGRYTTCDAAHPHYYFSSPEMKVSVGEKVFSDQPTLNVADVPIFYLPVGVFFPSHTGRQSGLIIPHPSQSAQRGFTLEGLGFYWTGGPISDYFDTRLESDLYSKGGYTFRDYSRIRWKGYIETLDIDGTWGRTTNDPDIPLTDNFILGANFAAGQQLIGRHRTLGGNLRFSSQGAIQNTASNYSPEDRLRDVTTQLITSDFSFSNSFDWGGSLSIEYNRSQNIITNELTETLPSFRFSIPTLTPFASNTGEGNFFETLSLGLGVSGQSTFIRSDTLPGGGFRTVDTRRSIQYSPSIGLSPKFGYFTIQPSVSMGGNIFFRRINKQPSGDTLVTHEFTGFFPTFTYSAGVSASTRLYGIVQPRILGLNAIRHTIVPTLGISYNPSFRDAYYDRVFNPTTNRIESYSIYEKDNFSASQQVGYNINFGLSNTFEAKIAQGDTLEDKNVRLLTLNMNGGYNAAPDAEFRWSTISMSASTDLGTVGSLQADATFDPYPIDSLGNRINELLIDRGQGLLRATRASLSFNTAFSDQGFSATTSSSPTTVPDSAGARRERFNFETQEFDQQEFFGERVRGEEGFRIPWQINLSGSYSLTAQSPTLGGGFQTSFNLRTDFSFSLTPTTKISSGFNYDLRSGDFLIPEINFYKDLHCWEMQFNWRPLGTYRGFRFELRIKSPQLQDLKLQRQEYFY